MSSRTSRARRTPTAGSAARPGRHSSELYSAWAAIGLAAAGRSPRGPEPRRAYRARRDRGRSRRRLRGAGDLERTILALRACGAPVRSLPGGDPVARLLRFRASDGSFGHLSNLTAFGDPGPARGRLRPPLGTRASGRRPGWHASRTRTAASASPPAEPAATSTTPPPPSRHWPPPRRGGGRALARAVSFLRHAQNLDGGIPQEPGGASNAQSTAWAVQGLIAARPRPRKVRARRQRSARSATYRA